MSVDDMVGHVFRTLRKLGETRRTLAIFTSDNGYLWTEHHFGNRRLRRFEARPVHGISPDSVVPSLAWARPAGSLDGRVTGTVDIAPTVLNAARVAPDPAQPPLDGHSLLSDERRVRIVLEHWRGNRVPSWASLRTRRLQYVEYYRDGRTVFREYYDLVRDPWQLRNLLHDGNPAGPDVAALSQQLQLDRRCVGTAGESACP